MSNASAISPNFTFYTRAEYFTNLAERINSTPKDGRVLLATMSFDAADPLVLLVMDALESAAKRGVQVYFAVDAYDFMIGNEPMGPLWWHKRLPKTPQKLSGFFKRNYDVLQRLQNAGVVCGVTNQPSHAFSNPFVGRSHIKVAVINDYCFVGGCNLHDHTQIDCMTGWQDTACADWLFNTIQPLVTTESSGVAFKSTDKQFTTPFGATLLLDAGVKKQSIIYENALNLIDAAHDWIIITSQFLPNSRTAERLIAAHKRGVKIHVLTNDTSLHTGVHKPIQHSVTMREKRRMPQEFFQTFLAPGLPYLHAKVLASEHEAMVGSHNYIPSGVNFGTAELAIRCQNSQFSRRAALSIVQQTNYANDSRFAFLKKSDK